MASAVMPAAASFGPSGSHTCRCSSHWCSSSTAGPPAGAAKSVPLRTTPSGAAMSTTRAAGGAGWAHADAHAIAMLPMIARIDMALMREPVHQVVHAELERLVSRIDRVPALAGMLHVVADVHVVVDDDHQALRLVVAFVDAVELAHQSLLAETARIRYVERLDREEAVEDRMRRVEPIDPRVGQHAPHRALEHGPLVVEMEVVDDQEPALCEILAKAHHFALARIPVARLGQVRDRKLQQLGVVHAEDVAAVR